MPGEKMRAAVAAQPEWLAQVPVDRRLPEGRVAVVGCGTSFHAAQTSGSGIDALEFLLRPPEADVLVLVSHEGTTPLTIEAAKAFSGEKWLVTAKRESELAALCDEVVVATPAVEESYCHTASATPARSRRSPRCGARTSPGCPPRSPSSSAAERLPVSDARALADHRRRPRLADRSGGGAEAARGRVSRRRGPPARGAPARPSRRSRRERPLLRAGGRGPRRRARGRCGRGAARARLRRHARADAPSGRRHRPVPAAHARPRGRSGASTPT